MWGFVDCTRYFRSVDGPRVVLDEANMVVGTRDKVALFVPTGQGKSTIVKLLAGLDLPDEGIVLRDEGGWPIGYGGSINQTMSGEANVRKVVDDFVAAAAPDPKVNFLRDGKFKELDVAALKQRLVEQISSVSGGPYPYTGRGMKEVHQGMGITDAEFDALAGHLKTALERNGARPEDVAVVLKVIGSTRGDIVEKK